MSNRLLFVFGAILLIVGMAMALLSPVWVVADGPTKYENYDTGDNMAATIYGSDWFAQTFTPTSAHTVSEIRLKLYRAGSPGTFYVSIRETDESGHPTGLDLTYGEIAGSTLSASSPGDWFSINLVSEYNLAESTKYAIVARASGDASNNVRWRYNGAAGSYSGGAYEASTNGGVSWTTTSAYDFMFEVWGNPVLEMEGAEVFSSVSEEGDWLIVFSYKNTYPPHYPSESPLEYFNIELRDDSSVLALVKMSAWGYRPGAIYLSSSAVVALDWGSGYKVRITGNPDKFETPPYDEYTLTSGDWSDSSLIWLDAWVIATAKSIAEYEGEDLTQDILNVGEILNVQGAIYFAVGIPYLPNIRPELFEYVVRRPGGDDTDWTLAGEPDTESRIGTKLMTALNNMGDALNLSGKTVGGLGVLILFLAAGALTYKASQNSVAAVVLPVLILVLGGWLGLVPLSLLAVMGSLAFGAMVYILWWKLA